MIAQENPPLHLAYCLNIHPGETLAEIRDAIQSVTLGVRDQVCPSRPFGLGLRLGNRAARELADAETRRVFKEFLDGNRLYVFTINGFPYGEFHGTRIKENVYRPDWRTEERRDYTLLLADILADLLPEGMSGSISTVPGSYKAWIAGDDDAALMAQRLTTCAEHMARLQDGTGKLIHLGLEPEPGCFLETTEEVMDFFRRHLAPGGRAEERLRRHVGVCFDTCHLAIQFEDLRRSAESLALSGIGVSKVQLSAAVQLLRETHSPGSLEPFAEPVYLHQTVARMNGGRLRAWPDLPAALEQLDANPDWRELRVHFHVPLYWPGSATIGTTAALLTDGFLAQLRGGIAPHLEIETYTYSALPDAVRPASAAECIAWEYAWVLQQLASKGRTAARY